MSNIFKLNLIKNPSTAVNSTNINTSTTTTAFNNITTKSNHLKSFSFASNIAFKLNLLNNIENELNNSNCTNKCADDIYSHTKLNQNKRKLELIKDNNDQNNNDDDIDEERENRQLNDENIQNKAKKPKLNANNGLKIEEKVIDEMKESFISPIKK